MKEGDARGRLEEIESVLLRDSRYLRPVSSAIRDGKTWDR